MEQSTKHKVIAFFMIWKMEHASALSKPGILSQINKKGEVVTEKELSEIVDELYEEGFLTRQNKNVAGANAEDWIFYYPNDMYNISPKVAKFGNKTGIFEHIKTFEHWTQDYNGQFWGKAGAGVLVICTTTNRMLIGLRSEDVEESGTLGIFGGKVDDRESDFEKVALRELYEETRYNGKIKMIPAYVYKTTSGKIKFEYHNFIGLVEEEFEPILDWENEDAYWMTYQDALNQPNLHFGLEKLLSVIEDYYPEIVTLS